MDKVKQKVIYDSWYTVRRYFVDKFFLSGISYFKEGMDIVDLGGKKTNKRGLFSIEGRGLNVKYVNLDESTEPDYLCEISKVPVDSDSFDGGVLAEVLEHIETPSDVLKEAARILKKDSYLLITVPFMIPVHADPYDFHRYTDTRLKNLLESAGFEVLSIQKQGGFAAVLINMLKVWNFQMDSSGKFKRNIIKKLTGRVVRALVKKSFSWDESEFCKNNKMLSGFTLGYEVIARNQKV